MMCPRMTDQEVLSYLNEYDELGFEDIPEWLRNEMKVRCIFIAPRRATEHEREVTIADAREHRIMNNELVLQDYIDKYKHGKQFTIT